MVRQSDAPTTRKTRRPRQRSGIVIVRAYQPMSALSGTPESGAPQGKGTRIGRGDGQRRRCSTPARSPSSRCVEGELPAAVQVHPLRALEVGPGVLGERDRVAPAPPARSRTVCGQQAQPAPLGRLAGSIMTAPLRASQASGIALGSRRVNANGGRLRSSQAPSRPRRGSKPHAWDVLATTVPTMRQFRRHS